MGFDLALIQTYGPRLLQGLGWTIGICAASIAAGFAWGLVLAVVARKSRWGAALVASYVAVLRGTPLLIQLFILYYGAPSFGLVLSAVQTGLLGLTLYAGAYFAEILRAGLSSVPVGQVEAACVLGFGRWRTFRYVQWPQMLVLILPPATNQAIILLKESAVLSVITVPELTFQTTRMVTETFAVIEPYLMLALLYWASAALVSRAGRTAEFVLTEHLRR